MLRMGLLPHQRMRVLYLPRRVAEALFNLRTRPVLQFKAALDCPEAGPQSRASWSEPSKMVTVSSGRAPSLESEGNCRAAHGQFAGEALSTAC